MSEAADFNFGDLFDAVARAVPERPAVVCGDHCLTWRELDERSNRLARHLQRLGCEPGAKVAFVLRNGPAYVELFAACVKARLVHVNVNYRYVGPELEHVLLDSDSEVVVYDRDLRDRIDALRPDLHQVRQFLEVGTDTVAAFAYDFESACVEGDAAPLAIERSGDDLYFMYTGGTTGRPKGVMWPHRERVAAIGMIESPNLETHLSQVVASTRPVALTACPLMHSTGLTTLLVALVNGGTLVLLDTRRFDPEACLRAIEEHEVQSVAIVGDAFSVPILETLRQKPGQFDLSRVTRISSAGAMWSEHCKQDLLEHFRNATLSDSLGASEGSRIGLSSTRRGERGATGRFAAGDGVKVFDEELREIAPGSGKPGRLAKAGPLPLGYYKDPEATAATFPTIDGVRYSMPGDWCLLDEDGTITLLGRGSHCINTGGEKVFPEEVEEALKTHEAIRDAAVLGVPDPRWGQAVVAVLRVDVAVDAEQVRAHLDTLLARYKHPKRILRVERDLRHANGKMNYPAVQRLWKREEANALHLTSTD